MIKTPSYHKFNLFLFIGVLVYSSSISQNPIAYYTFNSNALDKSGNNNNGIVHGSVTAIPDRFGNPCSAYFFDGNTGYISVSSSYTLESPEYALTICAWYKLSAKTSNQYWLTTVCKGESNTESIENPQYRLQVQQNKDEVINSCSLYYPSPSSTISLNTKFTICDNDFLNHLFEPETWHFYCMTYNGYEVSTYMDGKKVFSYSFSQLLVKNNSPLYIGVDEPGNKEYFSGALDDIRIYNSCLSESKITDLYNEKPITISQNEFELPIQEDINLICSSNSCEAKAFFQINTPKSVCGSVILIQKEGLPSGSSFPIGKNRIRFEASSSSGYKETLTFYVNVIDKTPPQIDKPADTIIYITYGEKEVEYNYSYPSSTDNCRLKWSGLKRGIPSAGKFSLGENILLFGAEDWNGNSAEVSCKIEVRELPQKNIPNPIIDTINKTQLTTDSSHSIDFNNSFNNTDSNVVYKDTLSVLKYKPNNIIFLIDASSSMKEDNKFGLLKKSIQTIITKLRSIDRITIITYADTMSQILINEPVVNKEKLIGIVGKIIANGSTEAEGALIRTYEIVDNNYLTDGNNDIYMATDGVFSLNKKIKKIITKSANNKEKKVTLNILAFGKSAASLMELKDISDIGKGQYLNISTEEEAIELILTQIKINSKK